MHPSEWWPCGVMREFRYRAGMIRLVGGPRDGEEFPVTVAFPRSLVIHSIAGKRGRRCRYIKRGESNQVATYDYAPPR